MNIGRSLLAAVAVLAATLAALSGAGRMHIVNAVELVMVLVNAGLVYILLEAGHGIGGW